MKWLKVTLILTALCLVGCKDSIAPGPTGESTNVHPDNDLSASLGDRVEMHGHSICPPKGYEHIPLVAPKHITISAWAGEPRSGGTRPVVQFFIASFPDGTKMPTFDEAVEGAIEAKRSVFNSWTQSELTYMDIGGHRFARVSWEGVTKSTELKLRGIYYVSRVENREYQLLTMDVAPNFKDLPVGEAALLTFEKVPN